MHLQMEGIEYAIEYTFPVMKIQLIYSIEIYLMHILATCKTMKEEMKNQKPR